MYVVFEYTGEGAFVSGEQMLSPRIMQWSEKVWLYDLQPCLSYWNVQAKSAELSLFAYLGQILSASMRSSYRAVLCMHPWQGLLLLTHMREKNLSGFLDRQDKVGSHLYRDVSWHSWWSCSEEISAYFDQCKAKSFKRAIFKQRSKQMRQAVERICALTPWELSIVGANAVYRRYGTYLKLLWEWAYPVSVSSSFSEGFPWVNQQQQVTMAVKRHLDAPIREWDHLAEELRNDFTRLCELTETHGHAQQRIVSLEWQLTLSDASHRIIPVRFRHPHLLARETPTHGTALLQAHYSFQSYMLCKEEQVIDEAEEQRRVVFAKPSIIGWELRISEFIAIPKACVTLFGDAQSDMTSLIELENRLPVALANFDLRNDWSAEESFAVYDVDHGVRQDHEDNAAYLSMRALAKERPLFMYHDKQLLKMEGRSALWRFCERTMAKWWRGDTGTPSVAGDRGLYCDYYRYVDHKKRALWVCRHPSQRWYVHGIFA